MMATAIAARRPEIKTELPGPKARAIIDADAQFVNPAYPRPDFKLVADRDRGVLIGATIVAFLTVRELFTVVLFTVVLLMTVLFVMLFTTVVCWTSVRGGRKSGLRDRST